MTTEPSPSSSEPTPDKPTEFTAPDEGSVEVKPVELVDHHERLSQIVEEINIEAEKVEAVRGHLLEKTHAMTDLGLAIEQQGLAMSPEVGDVGLAEVFAERDRMIAEHDDLWLEIVRLQGEEASGVERVVQLTAEMHDLVSKLIDRDTQIEPT